MWIRNTDNGKWFKQTDTITKDNFESLKVDLQRVKLYSKCLSGATYLTINDFDNLYPQLQQSHKGYYVNLQNDRGPSLGITNDNQDEFYEKYLREDGFTVKTLFTPEKLLNDQADNTKFVDVATTEPITIQPNNLIVIDGVRLIKGHRVLVKDQKSFITLSGIDEEDYFTNILPVTSFTHSQFETFTKTYEYYSNTNGIYFYDGYNLTKTNELDSYESTYKLILSVNLGEQNSNKQFHLERLKTGYYPIEGQSVEFKERNSWVLRNRVDYNNIFDLNYYDIKYFESESVFDKIASKKYDVPERVIAVGEFGIIVNNQDYLSLSATYSISNIISNKFKVNLRSISSNKNYYWFCGDEGTLIKVSKIDFSIEPIDLGEDLNFTSVSFYSDLYGMVVGKFNTIYYTRDGGYKWFKIQYDEFSNFSYNKVLHYDENVVYIVGESGVFMELVYSNEVWIGYLRDISKELSKVDYYPLVEDLNDIQQTNFVNIQSTTFSKFTNSNSVFENSLVFKTRLDRENMLEITIDSDIFNSVYYDNTFKFGIGLSFSNNNGYQYTSPDYEFDNQQIEFTNGLFSQKFFLPVVDGNIQESDITLEFKISHTYNYIEPFDELGSFTFSNISFSISAKKGLLLLMSGNNETVICHDRDSIIDQSKNEFVFLSFDKSFGDSMSISRRPTSNEVYLAGDKMYKFNIGDFNNISDIRTNSATGTLEEFDNIYANSIFTLGYRMYIAGNNSVTKYSEYITKFVDLDPTFSDRLDSKFLILDYDIGSKLNFFDDNGQYRLPSKLSIPLNNFTVSNTVFSINSIDNEVSWLDYYSDSEKTFAYSTHMEDSNVVKYSRNFTYDPYHTSFQLVSVGIGKDVFDDGVVSLAPHFSDPTNSEFISTAPIATQFFKPFDLYIHKNILIIKKSYNTKVPAGIGQLEYDRFSDKTSVGDVLIFTSDIVETKLTVNKIRHYTSNSTSGPGIFTQSKPTQMFSFDRLDTYLYCYIDFNENILNYFKKNVSTTKPITIKNLNRYKDQDDLVQNFNLHPYGIGYNLTKNDEFINFDGLFNEKTAYYNMQCRVSDSRENLDFKYKESFLNFGFTPTYNISTFLNKINSEIFKPQKDFRVLPKYFDLKGNNLQSAADDNIYIDSNRPSNYLRFGKNFYLQWSSLLINTFVDITLKTGVGDFFSRQYLITEKYYDTVSDSYFLRFNKKLNLRVGGNDDIGVRFIDILSRNSLGDISVDLQLLNNIHRSYTPTTILWESGNSTVEKTFRNYESSIKTKFSTESYLKAFVSDYDIRQSISAILYNDSNFEVSMNVLNLEKQSVFEISQIQPDQNNYLSFIMFGTQDELKIGDLIFLETDDVNSSIEGYQTVTFVNGGFIKTSKLFDFNIYVSSGRIKYIKQDPFFNFQPVDVFRSGSDRSVSRSVELLPKNTKLVGYQYSLINVNLNKFKIELVDGLSLLDLSRKYHWILEAEISNALIGENKNGLVWYSGTWRCGRWFGGTWNSGKWLSGDWYDGVWNAYSVSNNIISAIVDESFSDQRLSLWYNGRWFEGTWNDGTWFNGRRYAGDWIQGTWNNGIWNDGLWVSGTFRGGIWVQGTWESGTFNCDNKPSYWIDGSFKTGDFENGMWYNGVFGNEQSLRSRFGTNANNSRTATWHAGKWIDGEFHSFLNFDTETSSPTVSDIHKFSIWRTGIWTRGNWYGGIAFNIDFRGGTWHGGILEEIQVVGIDPITPSSTSKNIIYLNGIFKFNPGDEIWLIDDDRDTEFSPLGSNTLPRKYRINKIIEDDVKKQTALYLNYNLSSLGVSQPFANDGISDVDTGLRVVSYFKDVYWKSGLWTNGIFDGEKFDSGIWYNGIFEGVWGN